MSSLALTLAIGDYDRTGALKTGAVRPQGVDLNILTLSPEEIFYRMGRFLEFDACEFSLSTYTIRRGRGEPIIGIPVFPSQMFRPSSIFIGDKAGIREPKDLRGKRVGVPKYHMTAAVWIRGLLEDEYGVAPKDIRWFEGGEGAKVAAGELDAFIGARRPAAYGKGVSRLFPDFRTAERAYYERTRIFPIMHTVVLKEELVRQHPWLPRSLYDAFTEAKRLAYERLHFTAALLTSLPWQVAEAEETRALMGDDPFAYGIARNRKTVETLAGYLFRQNLAPRRLTIEEMFVPSLLDT